MTTPVAVVAMPGSSSLPTDPGRPGASGERCGAGLHEAGFAEDDGEVRRGVFKGGTAWGRPGSGVTAGPELGSGL